MAKKFDRLSALQKRSEEGSLERTDAESHRQTSRLNTNMDLELQRRLDIRRAMGHGTKTEQLDEATRIYLALFEGYGEVSPETLRAMERMLEEKRKN